MIPKRDSILKTNSDRLGVCGCYVPNRDSIHTGLFWSLEGDNRFVHFISTNKIEIREISDSKSEEYYFNTISDFPEKLMPSLIPLVELIAGNKLINLELNIENVVYNNGKFSLASGFYLTNNETERFINCAVLVIAILYSYDYTLLCLDSWPIVTDDSKRKYLEDWLDTNSIVDPAERDKYYQYNKEIRGKEVLVAPIESTISSPIVFARASELAEEFITHIKAS